MYRVVALALICLPFTIAYLLMSAGFHPLAGLACGAVLLYFVLSGFAAHDADPAPERLDFPPNWRRSGPPRAPRQHHPRDAQISVGDARVVAAASDDCHHHVVGGGCGDADGGGE